MKLPYLSMAATAPPAYVYDIDTSGADEGLTDCLQKANVSEEARKWVVSDEPNALFAESL